MRTCPKEEETVETCDGMNQKNMIFDKCRLEKSENREKLQKKKKKLRILGIHIRRKN